MMYTMDHAIGLGLRSFLYEDISDLLQKKYSYPLNPDAFLAASLDENQENLSDYFESMLENALRKNTTHPQIERFQVQHLYEVFLQHKSLGAVQENSCEKPEQSNSRCFTGDTFLPHFFEVHPENYLGGGLDVAFLENVRSHMPVSFHSVGLSLGSDHLPHPDHLKSLKALNDQFAPFLFSDHLSWSANGNAHLNDLLPLPYNDATFLKMVRNIDHVQSTLKRQILIENPSSYLELKDSESEPEFLNALCQKTGCGVLLDVNNVFVQCFNHKTDPKSYIDAINSEHIHQYHLAGHEDYTGKTCDLKIDTHNQHVCSDVWDLYEYTLKTKGNHPTLIEWDSDCESYADLCRDAKVAQNIMDATAFKTNALLQSKDIWNNSTAQDGFTAKNSHPQNKLDGPKSANDLSNTGGEAC